MRQSLISRPKARPSGAVLRFTRSSTALCSSVSRSTIQTTVLAPFLVGAPQDALEARGRASPHVGSEQQATPPAAGELEHGPLSRHPTELLAHDRFHHAQVLGLADPVQKVGAGAPKVARQLHLLHPTQR